jgi:hypothetical protein
LKVETKGRLKAVDAHTFIKKAEKSLNKRLPARKLMATVFWERKGLLMVEFMQQGTTITPEVYCRTLKNCIGPFRTKGMEC